MELEQTCGMMIKKINNTLEKNANNDLRSNGLTLTQMAALIQIMHTSEKQLSLKELEKALCVAQSTAAGIVSRLEQKGFVLSLGDAADKRIKLVRITDSGKQYCEAARQRMTDAETQLLSVLTDAERGSLYSLLEKVSHAIG